MRPLTTVQILKNNNLLLTCTICQESQEVFTAIFPEKQRAAQMRSFNTRHAKAHAKEPEIKDRIIKPSDLDRG